MAEGDPYYLLIDPDDIEAIGKQADAIDNLIAALSLPLPDPIHLQALRESLPNVSQELKRIVVEVSGENPWE